MKVVTYLINLDGSDQRLASATEQLQQANWEFTRFPAYDGRGKALSEFKNYDDAIKYFNTLITMNPEFSQGYIGRAYSYQKLGEHQKAVTDLKTLIGFDKSNKTAYYLKALSENALDRPTLACNDLRQAITLGSEEAFNLYKKTCN